MTASRPLALAAAGLILLALWGLPRIGAAALIGGVAFIALARSARVSMAFGAFGCAAAVMFGFMTAVMAQLHGLPVTDLLARPFADFVVPNVLGMATVSFAVLGLASLAWGRLTRRYGRAPAGGDQD
jgi:hypothetical protein